MYFRDVLASFSFNAQAHPLLIKCIWCCTPLASTDKLSKARGLFEHQGGWFREDFSRKIIFSKVG